MSDAKKQPFHGIRNPATGAQCVNSFEVQQILKERQQTHGDYSAVAAITHQIKQAHRSGPTYNLLTIEQREALDMLAVKQARIVCGDSNYPDHWNDIEGYAKLGSLSCIDPNQGELFQE